MSGYSIPPEVLRAELAGDEVLLNPNTGQYHLVNATGREVLLVIESGASLEDAARSLSERTGRSERDVLADLHAFVKALLERGLLVREG